MSPQPTLNSSSLIKRLAANYDELPYGSHAFRATHPLRLATSAFAGGLEPAPPNRCRVLELGCAEGGNMIPMADAYPDSHFVGIDLSARQVELATTAIADLGLQNASVMQLDIMGVDDRLGFFDYIICHGVYSWVPPEVQAKILEICRTRLNLNGVCYVSYNTLPGWHIKSELRSLMLEHVAGVDSLPERIRAARELLTWIKDAADTATPYGAFLKQQAEIAAEEPDSMIAHEYLAMVNDPLTVETFVERVHAAGLRHLSFGAEAEAPAIPLPPRGLAAGTNLELRQHRHSDVLENNTFRRAVLCRSDVGGSAEIDADRVVNFEVATHLTVTAPVELEDDSSVTFERDGEFTTTSSPHLKVALAWLAEIWPMSESISELAERVARRLGMPAESVTDEFEQQLAGVLLDLHSRAVVDVLCARYQFIVEVRDQPVASPTARMQVAGGHRVVTSRRHEHVELGDLSSFLLPLLDGSRSEDQLIAAAREAAAAGRLVLPTETGSTITDRDEQIRVLRWMVPRSLDMLARSALLVD